MTQIKTHEFLLANIFKVEYGNKFDKNKMSCINPSVNFVSRTATNNGVSGFVDKIEGVEPYTKGTITLALGGSIGSCFVQTAPFYTGQNMGVIILPDYVSDGAKKYISCLIAKKCKSLFVTFSDEINKHLKTDLSVSLPVIKCTEENHEYTIDDIDFDYMDKYISDLELECVNSLEGYLKKSKLEDCTLSKEDIKILGRKVKFGKYQISFLFEKLSASYKGIGRRQDNVSKIQNDEFSLPLINCKDGNNGIMYYGREQDFDYYTNVLSVIYNGPPTVGQVYAQEKIGVYTDAYLIALKKEIMTEMSLDLCFYLKTAVEKAIHNTKYSRADKATWDKKVENDYIYLPTSDGINPDYEYMEKYIQAQKKIVIKGTVEFKNKIVSK